VGHRLGEPNDQGTRGELLDRLAGAIESFTTPHPLRVAVDGPPAAGKTTLADELARLLRARGREVIGDLAEAVTRLKRERSGGYLLAQGGVRFARSLVETGLIDEYRLVVHPVVLGEGERLFRAPHTIKPVSTTVFSGGAVAHVFAAPA
jgi:dihydrofolate reductase